jgi:hypothetical protein
MKTRLFVFIGLVGALGFALAIVACVLVMGAGAWLGGNGLGGTDLRETDLSRAEQLKLLNEFSPVPIPESASDVRLRYQRFQDWSFRATFTLPPGEYEAFVGQLRPEKPAEGSPAGISRYHGKVIGSWEGYVETDGAARHITIAHASN